MLESLTLIASLSGMLYIGYISLKRIKELEEENDMKNKLLQSRDKFIDGEEKRIKQFKEENKELRFENEEMPKLGAKVIEIINSKDSLVNKYDKIKELVDKYQLDN